MIAAGRLNRRVTLQIPHAVTNDAGEGTTSYADAYRVYAEIKQQSAIEAIRNGVVDATMQAAITIRYLPDIDEKCRVVYCGVVYQIKSAAEVGLREELSLLCAEAR